MEFHQFNPARWSELLAEREESEKHTRVLLQQLKQEASRLGGARGDSFQEAAHGRAALCERHCRLKSRLGYLEEQLGLARQRLSVKQSELRAAHFRACEDRNNRQCDECCLQRDVVLSRASTSYVRNFDALERKMQEYDIRAEDTYNMDEKGFLIGILPKGKRVFSRRTYEREGIRQRLQDGNREWITTIACICADKTSLSPSLIYQAVSGNLQDSWLQDFNTTSQRCFFAASPSGWINNELGYAWLRDVFDRETREKARRRWRLLILDGHGSHVTMKFLNYCDDNKILTITFPPHSTHSLQLLDVGIFSPLSKAYGDQLERFLHNSQGLGVTSKRDFFPLFWKAWDTALLSNNIESSWRSVGIWPWNSEHVLARFTKLPDERPSSSESSKLILQAEDWRRIERLLKRVVSDVYDQNTKKLSSTMHHLSTENIILKLRCHGLEEALVNEKRNASVVNRLYSNSKIQKMVMQCSIVPQGLSLKYKDRLRLPFVCFSTFEEILLLIVV